jgi:hypothetical protein
MRKATKSSEGRKAKVDANPGGRPSKYLPAFCDQVEMLCKLGATDKELADFFGIVESTLNEWKLKYPKFSESIKRGKMIADAVVSDRLFKRATGYEHPDVDIKVVKGKIVTTKLTKHYPPDTTAAIFWLKNRQKEKWRDKVEATIDLNETIRVGYGPEDDD